jgi:hypothetical protein
VAVKNLFATALAVALSGCTTTQHIKQPTLPDGVWSGTLKSVLVLADDDKQEGASDLLIASCKGLVRFWARDQGGTYEKLGNNYVIQSYPDSHLIYSLAAAPTQPDWVEIQSYALLEIDSDTAVLQWSRAVNNRDVAMSKKNRYFFAQGMTKLHRTNRSCDERLVP